MSNHKSQPKKLSFWQKTKYRLKEFAVEHPVAFAILAGLAALLLTGLVIGGILSALLLPLAIFIGIGFAMSLYSIAIACGICAVVAGAFTGILTGLKALDFGKNEFSKKNQLQSNRDMPEYQKNSFPAADKDDNTKKRNLDQGLLEESANSLIH